MNGTGSRQLFAAFERNSGDFLVGNSERGGFGRAVNTTGLWPAAYGALTVPLALGNANGRRVMATLRSTPAQKSHLVVDHRPCGTRAGREAA